MKKLFLIICAVGLMMTGCGVSTAPNEKIIVGMDESPLGYRDAKGELVGFEVDLAKETARRMGVALEFKLIDWDNKENELNAGNIDMIWNGCDIMEEYKEYMIFSRPYMNNRQILMVREGNGRNIRSEYDLAGKVVGTQAGSNSEDYVNDNEKLKNSFKAFKTYRNIKEGFELLRKGEYDVIIVDEVAARYEKRRDPVTLDIVNLTIGPATKFGIGFRKGNEELRDKVQEVFAGMIKDGTAREISLKWFQADLIKHNR